MNFKPTTACCSYPYLALQQCRSQICEHNVIEISNSDTLVILIIWRLGCSATKGLGGGGPAGLQGPTQTRNLKKKTKILYTR